MAYYKKGQNNVVDNSVSVFQNFGLLERSAN